MQRETAEHVPHLSAPTVLVHHSVNNRACTLSNLDGPAGTRENHARRLCSVINCILRCESRGLTPFVSHAFRECSALDREQSHAVIYDSSSVIAGCHVLFPFRMA